MDASKVELMVAPMHFPGLCAALLAIGLALVAWFSAIQSTSGKESGSLTRELTIALLASASLGWATFFGLLANGIWV